MSGGAFSLSVPGDDVDGQSGREARRARRHSRGGAEDRAASPLPSEVSRIATTLSKTPTASTRTFDAVAGIHQLKLNTEDDSVRPSGGDDSEYEQFAFTSPKNAVFQRQNTEGRINAAHAESARRWGANSLQDKWSNTVVETKTKNGFAKNHVVWAFVLDDEEHRIDLFHSVVSGKKRLVVNDVEKDVSGSKLGTIFAVDAARIKFKVNDTKMEIAVYKKGNGQAYDLFIDGEQFDVARDAWIKTLTDALRSEDAR